MVTIRLARMGAKKQPYYHITVAESRNSRDGRFIERLGFFNPVARGQAERLRLDIERVDHWLSVGARPSARVSELLKQARNNPAAVAGPVSAEAEADALAAEAS